MSGCHRAISLWKHYESAGRLPYIWTLEERSVGFSLQQSKMIGSCVPAHLLRVLLATSAACGRMSGCGLWESTGCIIWLLHLDLDFLLSSPALRAESWPRAVTNDVNDDDRSNQFFMSIWEGKDCLYLHVEPFQTSTWKPHVNPQLFIFIIKILWSVDVA